MFDMHPEVSSLVNDVLVWIGYGTVIGLLAKAIMPGRDPGGPIATLAMGVAGVIIGCGVLSLFSEGLRVTPISFPGMFCGTAGAFVILGFYRILGGHWYDEADHRTTTRRRRSRRRRYRTADF